jgi:hypothetical protein
MSTKADYSSEEWQLLLDVPPAVGTAVMYAGRSGMGSVKEAMAMASGILGARNGYEGNELIESLVNARLKDGEKSTIETLSSPYRGLSPENILEDAVDKCRSVASLLKSKATEEEVKGYVDWSISLAEKVASAAKEGGFLGIGGERVSEEERRAIHAVRDALSG